MLAIPQVHETLKLSHLSRQLEAWRQAIAPEVTASGGSGSSSGSGGDGSKGLRGVLTEQAMVAMAEDDSVSFAEVQAVWLATAAVVPEDVWRWKGAKQLRRRKAKKDGVGNRLMQGLRHMRLRSANDKNGITAVGGLNKELREIERAGRQELRDQQQREGKKTTKPTKGQEQSGVPQEVADTDVLVAETEANLMAVRLHFDELMLFVHALEILCRRREHAMDGGDGGGGG